MNQVAGLDAWQLTWPFYTILYAYLLYIQLLSVLEKLTPTEKTCLIDYDGWDISLKITDKLYIFILTVDERRVYYHEIKRVHGFWNDTIMQQMIKECSHFHGEMQYHLFVTKGMLGPCINYTRGQIGLPIRQCYKNMFLPLYTMLYLHIKQGVRMAEPVSYTVYGKTLVTYRIHTNYEVNMYWLHIAAHRDGVKASYSYPGSLSLFFSPYELNDLVQFFHETAVCIDADEGFAAFKIEEGLLFNDNSIIEELFKEEQTVQDEHGDKV